MTAQLVIPMTGVSSRFTAAGYPKPKYLLDVDGQTVIEHVIDMYAGWTDVLFICNDDALADASLGLRELLLGKVPTAEVVGVPTVRKGPAWAILQARDHIAQDRPVVVNYCDFTAVWDADGFAALLAGGEVAGAIPCYTGFHPHMVHSTSYAYVKLADDGSVVDIQEKQPWTDSPMDELASSGTYGFDSGARLLAAIEEQVRREDTLGDEFYLSLTYRNLLDAGAVVRPFPVAHFMQWGTPQDFEEYQDYSRAFAAWARRVFDPAPYTHNRVVLAAGAGERFSRAGYTVPKPALSLSGRPLIEWSAAAVPGDETVVVTRDDLPHSEVVDDVATRLGAEVVHLPSLSAGQAVSALAGLRAIRGTAAVTVTACDAIPSVTRDALAAALELAGADGMVCWVARQYRTAHRRPEQYGWVGSGADGIVRQLWLKERPTGEAGVVIGTFSFPTAVRACADIEALVASGRRVRGEFYLDSLIAQLLEEGRPVVALDADPFVSVGTPDEYESVRYWQAAFHQWPLHPYSLASDPMVAVTDRARLDRDLRRPFETAVR